MKYTHYSLYVFVSRIVRDTYIPVVQCICILGRLRLLGSLCCRNTVSFRNRSFHPTGFQSIHQGRYRMADVDLVCKPHSFHKSLVLHKHSCIPFVRMPRRWSCKIQYPHIDHCFYIFLRGHKRLLYTRESLGSHCFCYISEHIVRSHKPDSSSNLVRIYRVL